MKVNGFKSADSLPTFIAVLLWSNAAILNLSFSTSCLEKALTTLTPSKFSLVIKEILSSFFWITLYRGIDFPITKYKVSTIRGIDRKNISESFRFINIAIIAEPKIINGALTPSLIAIATATCSWFTSFIILVINDGVPILSISEWERLFIWRKSSFLSFVPKPWEALAAKYWQTRADPNPTIPRIIINIPILIMYDVS